jgi:mono/diheme cytochrome c family protein
MRRSSVFVAIALLLPLAGCEWFSTMSDPASIEPHEREPRLAPANSVPLNGPPVFDLTNADERVSNTQPSSPASLEFGRAWYDTYCAICHGRTGRGDGPLTRRFPAVPAIATERVAGYTDPYVFALITKGRGLMPEYSRIPPTARWDIVNYLRTLPIGPPATSTPAAAADTAGGAP